MSKKPLSLQDPYAQREAERYEDPIPSREFLMDWLAKASKKSYSAEAVFRALALAEEQALPLQKRLAAMVRDGQLELNRSGEYEPINEEDLIRGRVQGHAEGFGFLIPDAGGTDFTLSAREMRRVFHGDIVLAKPQGYDRKGRREAQIVRVVQANTHIIVGRFYEEDGQSYVIPDHPKINQSIVVIADKLMPTQGQLVTIEIVQYPSTRVLASGRIIEILGDYLAPGMEIDIAIRTFDIPYEWPESVLTQVKDFTAEVAECDKENREDIRQLPLVTIDGEDARDFDDAVYCEKRRGGYRLIVAIADVSHYVQADTALDQEALKRGNSVYFPQHVVPMLPEILSNGLCSLNAHVDRLCMVCDMSISLSGNVTGYKFYEAVMHSHARLTYTKVAALLQDPESELAIEVREKTDAKALESVHLLYDLFHVFRGVREKRGALDFDGNETRIIFNKERKIEKIIPVERNDAHKLIEECMLAANVCAADFAAKNELPTLFRNHEGPRDEKLLKLKQYLSALGIPFLPQKKPVPSDFQGVLAHIQDRPDAHNIQTVLLRSLTQAVYAPENLGHFGLAYEAYAHFTSPIRRYPDLLLHRVIRAQLRAQKEHLPDMAKMVAFGQHCSMTERRADEATRDVVAWLKCEYMQDRIGEDFAGVITAVTAFGIFVELKDIYVEGLVHISQLKDDYYQYDAVFQKLIGERSGVEYVLGMPVHIKVAAVHLDERKMDFELLQGGKLARKSKKAAFAEHDDAGFVPLKKGKKPVLKGKVSEHQAKPKKKSSSSPARKKPAPSRKKK
jgi:ribonuclease R